MNKTWIKAALVRAIKTMAQSAIGVIGAAAAFGDVNWPMVLSAAVVAGIVSILTSIEGLPEVTLASITNNTKAVGLSYEQDKKGENQSE